MAERLLGVFHVVHPASAEVVEAALVGVLQVLLVLRCEVRVDWLWSGAAGDEGNFSHNRISFGAVGASEFLCILVDFLQKGLGSRLCSAFEVIWSQVSLLAAVMDDAARPEVHLLNTRHS